MTNIRTWPRYCQDKHSDKVSSRLGHKRGLKSVNIKCWHTTHDTRHTTTDDGQPLTLIAHHEHFVLRWAKKQCIHQGLRGICTELKVTSYQFRAEWKRPLVLPELVLGHHLVSLVRRRKYWLTNKKKHIYCIKDLKNQLLYDTVKVSLQQVPLPTTSQSSRECYTTWS